jgi:hypothetical protein
MIGDVDDVERTVNVYVANAVGVPERTPPSLNVVPVGMKPDTTLNPGAKPLVAARVVV